MHKLSFKLALHFLLKNRLTTIINIIGLSVGILSLFLISIWIKNELSYDRFHSKSERIYRFTLAFKNENYQSHFARVSNNWTMKIPRFFPEVESMVRIHPLRKTAVKIEDKKFNEERFFAADSSLLDVFDFEFAKGGKENALQRPFQVMLSQSTAQKYFGNKNPLGEQIKAFSQYDSLGIDYTVTAVYKDFPIHSHFHPDLIASIEKPNEHVGWAYVYLLLQEDATAEKILDKFPGFFEVHTPENTEKQHIPHLQKLTQIHLYSNKDRELEENGNHLHVYIFALVGMILFFIGIINYTNLCFANQANRHKFNYLNHIFGSTIKHIFAFLFWESLLINFIALVVTSLSLVFAPPILANILNDRVFIDGMGNPIWNSSILIGLFIISTIVGAYPQIAYVLRVKKNNFQSIQGGLGFRNSKGVVLRKSLLVFQFAVAIVLVIVSSFIYLQTKFVISSGIGQKQAPSIVMRNLPRMVLKKYQIFKESLSKHPSIDMVTASMEEPSYEILDAMAFETSAEIPENKDALLAVLPCDVNFPDFFKLNILAGSSFPEYQGMQAPENYILNESAVKLLGFKRNQDAIGHDFKLKFDYAKIFNGGKIVGVVEDFHFSSMKKTIKPLVLFQKEIWFYCFLIKPQKGMLPEALQYAETTWNELYPNYPFEYTFSDDLYHNIYQYDIKQGTVLGLFSLIALIITCLGLYGIVTFLMVGKVKEIAVKKVMGAKPHGLFMHYLLDSLKVVFLAIVVSFPLAYYFSQKWLDNFTYKLPLLWWVFALAGAFIVLISVITVAQQIINVSRTNPALSLKHD